MKRAPQLRFLKCSLWHEVLLLCRNFASTALVCSLNILTSYFLTRSLIFTIFSILFLFAFKFFSFQKISLNRLHVLVSHTNSCGEPYLPDGSGICCPHLHGTTTSPAAQSGRRNSHARIINYNQIQCHYTENNKRPMCVWCLPNYHSVDNSRKWRVNPSSWLYHMLCPITHECR